MSKVQVRDVHYNVRIDGSGPPLLMLHGFTGSVQSWDHVLNAFTPHFTIVRVDLLGHGASDAPADHRRYSLGESAVDLHILMQQLGFAQYHLLGYSMGGRAALHVAATMPERLVSLVLESAALGIEDHIDRMARVRSDDELANFIEQSGIEAFVERWEQTPLFATERKLPWEIQQVVRAQRLANRPIGLANSLRGAGAGAQEYLLDRMRTLDVPTLIIAGALDAKYCAVAKLLGSTLPSGEVAIVPDSGHAVHRERPDKFCQTVLGFLRSNRIAAT